MKLFVFKLILTLLIINFAFSILTEKLDKKVEKLNAELKTNSKASSKAKVTKKSKPSPKCVAKDCNCYSSDDLVIPSSSKCLHSKMASCYGQHAACKRINNKCTWIYNAPMRKCMNDYGHCKKSGCDLENCVVDDGKVVKLKCPNIPFPAKKCYEKALCGVIKDGSCAYEKDAAFLACMKTK